MLKTNAPKNAPNIPDNNTIRQFSVKKARAVPANASAARLATKGALVFRNAYTANANCPKIKPSTARTGIESRGGLGTPLALPTRASTKPLILFFFLVNLALLSSLSFLSAASNDFNFCLKRLISSTSLDIGFRLFSSSSRNFSTNASFRIIATSGSIVRRTLGWSSSKSFSARFKGSVNVPLL